MLISEILKRKGDDVATTTPDSTIRSVVATLAELKVGALVVSADGDTIDGIISERDLVRGLAADDAGLMQRTAADLMTADVVCCSPTSSIDELMGQMTQGRFRHVPVREDGSLVGIVSIGDIVNARLDELETERQHLTDYISGR